MSRKILLIKYFIGNALQGVLGNKKRSPIATVLSMLVAMVCISLPFASLVFETYDTFSKIGIQSILIELFLAIGSATILVFGMYSILNTFYFSKDIEPIMYMPFKSSEIILGKFISALLEMYLYTGIIIVPLIAYGVKSSAGIMYYLYSVAAVIILPIIPMIIGSLICMLLMRFTNLSKHKDGIRVLAGVFILVIVVVFNFISKTNSSNLQENGSAVMLSNNSTLINNISNILFTNSIITKALVYSSELKGLLFVIAAIVISVCLFGIYYVVGGKLYYNSIIGISETFSKGEDVFKSNKVNKTIKTSSQLKALVNKEIRILFRTPQFFLNGVAMLFYMPAVLLVVALSNGNAERIKNALTLGTNYYGYAIVATFGVATIAMSAGGAAITAVSREGQDFLISKYIPIDPKTQILAKMLAAIIVNQISSVIVIGVMIYLNAPLDLMILSIIISILGVTAMSLIELFMDYKDPRLDWQSERDIYKKNFLPVILPFAVCALTGVLIYMNYLLKSYLFTFVITAILLVVTCFVFYNLINKEGLKLYNED